MPGSESALIDAHLSQGGAYWQPGDEDLGAVGRQRKEVNCRGLNPEVIERFKVCFAPSDCKAACMGGRFSTTVWSDATSAQQRVRLLA